MWLSEQILGVKLTFAHLIFTLILSSSNSANNSSDSNIISSPTEASPSCVCVPFFQCDSDNTVITNGQGSIDIRLTSDASSGSKLEEEIFCDSPLDVCCRLPHMKPNSSMCGHRRPNIIQHLIPRLDKDLADEGEFPWMVTIFRTMNVRETNGTVQKKVYQCQGTLINRRVVLTTAQCVWEREAKEFSIRAGQVDTMLTIDELRYQERDVERIITPEKFNPIRLRNNVALLVLKSSVNLQRLVNILCLVGEEDDFDRNKCLVLGWDKYLSPEDVRTQRSQSNPLKRRSEPYVSRDDCNKMLRKTPLGKNYSMNNCSICAGGPPGRNFCSRETGGAFICPLKNNPSQYVQVGIASWCINAGNIETPSVFTSVIEIRKWIDNKLLKVNIDSSPYRSTIN